MNQGNAMSMPDNKTQKKPLPEEAIACLMCHDCQGSFEQVDNAIRCTGCGRVFPVIRGTIQMMPDSAPQSPDYYPHRPEDGHCISGDNAQTIQYEEVRFGSARGKKRNIWEQKIVEWFLSQHPDGLKVIDVPCGMGRFNHQNNRRGNKVISLDRDFDRVVNTVSRPDGPSFLSIQGDALKLPFQKDSFDVALCVRLTHHLAADELFKLLKELARVAPECLITFYNANTIRTWNRKIKKRLSGKQPAYSFSFSLVRDLAASAGLSITDRFPRHGFFHRPIQFLRMRRTK